MQSSENFGAIFKCDIIYEFFFKQCVLASFCLAVSSNGETMLFCQQK